jgi:hypothetical protein
MSQKKQQKHMSPFETLQVHCCSSFEIAEKAARFYLLTMSPEEKIEALKNMDRHGSEQDQNKIFNAQIQEKIFNAQMMKGKKNLQCLVSFLFTSSRFH